MLTSQLVNGSVANGLVVNGLVAIDPVTEGGLLWTPLLIILVKVLVIFVLGLVGTMLMVWFERKVVSGMQNRVGPNKAGPAGLLQTLADGLKLFFKEDLLPNRAVPRLRTGISRLGSHPARRRLLPKCRWNVQ